MSRFHVGDKVVFDINAYIADTGGKSSWADEVPTTPMTVTEIDGHTHKMEETMYTFHDNWIRPAKFEFREKGLGIERVLFNNPATIVFWTDGTKTVVKCRKGDEWDAEKGLAMACAKKLMGNRDGYHKTLATYYKEKRVWEKGMGTEQIRAAVSRGCLLSNGCDNCPCCPSKGGTCYIIALADRGELITMLKEFEEADKWSYEDWRMRYA